MAFSQEACLALFAYNNEGFAALEMEALEPSSAVARSPHGIWDEHMGDHPNFVCGAICGDRSRSRCEGWMELPTHVTVAREVNGADWE